jgi:hypothetical protein
MSLPQGEGYNNDWSWTFGKGCRGILRPPAFPSLVGSCLYRLVFMVKAGGYQAVVRRVCSRSSILCPVLSGLTAKERGGWS